MKKKVLISIVLLAIIGTSAVFAQAPTLDKLKFVDDKKGSFEAWAANNQITGAVVIPDTYNDKPVTTARNFGRIAGITSVTFPNSLTSIEINTFGGCTGLTSVTIPASVTKIENGAFRNCTNLTSVTFGRSDTALTASKDLAMASNSFDGDLGSKYQAGGAGTYTREAGGKEWTKQGGFSLSGVWTRADGMKITITDNGSNITITGDKPNNGGKLNDTYTKK